MILLFGNNDVVVDDGDDGDDDDEFTAFQCLLNVVLLL